MDTTIPDGGTQVEQPTQESEAVTPGYNADQVITTDNNGTPDLAPVTSQSESAPEAAEAPQEPAQATAEPAADETVAWAEKKGLKINPNNATEVKLAQMQREAERKMHEASAKARELENTVTQVPVDVTGDPQYDTLAQSVNQLLIQNSVRDFFSNNPEARDYESKMAEIVTQRPHLRNDLDALYALAKTDPSRETELKQQGGKEALENLAQKQQQIPPGANATNSRVYESSQINPQNVYDLVDRNDQAWFEKNYDAIQKAMSGK